VKVGIMETLETLSKRIATTTDLQSIVRTMKSLSAVSIRQYEHAVSALREYNRATELGLQVLLGESSFPDAGPEQTDGPTAAIIFGSDHGLCGRFNEQIGSFAQREMRERDVPDADRLYLVVGVQAASRLEAMGQPIDECFYLPGSVSGLTATAQSVLLKIDEWRSARGIARVLVFYNSRSAEQVASPICLQLLPLDLGWLQRLAKRRWPSHVLPTHTMTRRVLFSYLIREHLFVTIFRAGAESMASEHATRLASMQAAEHNIQEHLEEMTGAFHRRRQQGITEELLDIVAGFETLRTAELSGQDDQ
jgi:F-type H+-transporting ATPase subunit gamma